MRRGFSLIETLLVMVVMGLLLGLFLRTPGRQVRQADTQQFARLLVAELNAARMQAISHQSYVGLVFPSAANDHSFACSAYQVEGPGQGRVTRRLYWGREFPHSSLFVGQWALPGRAFSRQAPPTGLQPLDFDLQQWYGGIGRDWAVVFSPSGSLISNDLPNDAGSLHLVAGSNLEAVPCAPPPGSSSVTVDPAYYQLNSLAEPHRITISPGGEVSLEAGMGDAQGISLTVAQQPLSRPVSGAALTTSDTVPVVEKITLDPTPASVPAGVEGMVGPEGFLRLNVEASDADGESLTCQWTKDGGAFTSNEPTRMRWDPARQRWTATWVFQPNSADPAGTRYQLGCRVEDEKGHLATAAAGVTLVQDIEFRKPTRVSYGRVGFGPIFIQGTDGSDQKRLDLDGIGADFTRITPDGTGILFTDNQNGLGGTVMSGQVTLKTVNLDGSNLRQITNVGSAWGACYSPDGTSIVAASDRAGTRDVWLYPACGEVDPVPGAPAPRQLTTGYDVEWGRLSFDRTGKKISFVAHPGGGTDTAVYVYHLDTNSVTQATPLVPLQPGLPDCYQAHYFSDATHANMLIGIYPVGPGIEGLYVVNDDGTGFHPINCIAPQPHGGDWCVTPDGLSVLYQDTTGQNKLFKASLDLAGFTLDNATVLANGIYPITPACW